MEKWQSISHITWTCTWISLLYSIIWYIWCRVTSGSMNYFANSWLIESSIWEYSNWFLSIMVNYYTEAFHEYSIFWIYLSLLLLAISQTREASKEKYQWKSIIWLIISLFMSIFFRYTWYLTNLSYYWLYWLWIIIPTICFLYPFLVFKRDYKHIIYILSFFIVLILLVFLWKKYFF